MLAVKGYYKDGRIEIIEPLPPDIKEANVIVIVQEQETEEPAQGYFEIIDAKGVLHRIPNWTEEEWREIGLRSFFGTSDEYDECVEVIKSDTE